MFQKKTITRGAAGLALASSVALAGCSSGDDAVDGDLTQLRMGLNYIAMVQHFPMYWAENEGGYAEAGLTVDIQQGGDTPALALLAADEIDIAVADPFPILAAVESGQDLVVFATQFQESSTAMTCRSDSGVEQPSDLAGTTLGMKQFALDDLPLIASGAGLSEDDFEVQPVGNADLSAIISGSVDCLYTTVAQSEPFAIQEAGIDTNVFPVGEFGIAAQQNVYVTTREKWEDPETHEALITWLEATADAYQTMFDDPDAAGEYMVDHAFAEGLDLGEELFQSENQIPFILTEHTAEHGLLALDPQTWHETAEIALEFGRTSELVDVDAILDLTAVEEAGLPRL